MEDSNLFGQTGKTLHCFGSAVHGLAFPMFWQIVYTAVILILHVHMSVEAAYHTGAYGG